MYVRLFWWIGRAWIVAAMVVGVGLAGCGDSGDESGIGDVVESPDGPGGEDEIRLTPA